MIIQVAKTHKISQTMYLLNEKRGSIRLCLLPASGKTETENWNKWRGLQWVLTNIIGICEISWPLSSLITAQIGRNSSRLCREHTEYTKMKAWPLLMESRCIAGNWWDPVVSVIWSVHMFLSQLITWNTVMWSVDLVARLGLRSDRLDPRLRFPIRSRHPSRLDSESSIESSQSRLPFQKSNLILEITFLIFDFYWTTKHFYKKSLLWFDFVIN